MSQRLIFLVCLLLLSAVGCRSSRPAPVQFDNQSLDRVSHASFNQIDVSQGNDLELAGEYSVEQLVEIAMGDNPGIAAARFAADAARHRAPQEFALPDPVLNTTTYLAPVQTAAGEQDFALGISQKYVDSRRRNTRAAMAGEEYAAARAEVVAAELSVAERVRVTCFRILAVREFREITRMDLEQLEQIRDVAMRRYEVDTNVSQKDVLAIQLEQSSLTNRLIELDEQEARHKATLARLVSSRLPDLIEVSGGMAEPSFSAIDFEELTAVALQMRPELQSQIARVRRDRKAICLARLSGRPDMTVGLNWIATSTDGISPVANGEDALLLGVGFNLPVRRDRIQGAVCEATSRSLASQARLENTQDEITSEIFDAISTADSAREMLLLLDEEMVPTAERIFNLSINEYAEGETDYVQLIENWRALLRYRTTRIRLLSEYNISIAALSKAVGSLEPLQDLQTNSHTSESQDFEDWEGPANDSPAGAAEDASMELPPEPNEPSFPEVPAGTIERLASYESVEQVEPEADNGDKSHIEQDVNVLEAAPQWTTPAAVTGEAGN
ncbi:MAG: TolC family protein [Planctomycetota bacterium]